MNTKQFDYLMNKCFIAQKKIFYFNIFVFFDIKYLL